MFAPNLLAQADPEVWNAVRLENQRQEDHVELIASENYVSTPVLLAQGSQLTNKYAEGYPGKRYYGGCEYVDIAESIAIERAKKLFGSPWANVQPHSGSQANQSVYTAALLRSQEGENCFMVGAMVDYYSRQHNQGGGCPCPISRFRPIVKWRKTPGRKF